VNAFIQTGLDHGYEFKIIKAANSVNEIQKKTIIKKIAHDFPKLEGLTIAVWGLAFKPKTDDMREAPSLEILPELLKSGAKLRAFDPVAAENAKKILGTSNIEYVSSPYDAANGADILLILTEWDEFRAIDLSRIASSMKGKSVFDGRNIYQPAEMEKLGFKYVGVGR
jgi:UDPglucose 6-dehydrogenase